MLISCRLQFFSLTAIKNSLKQPYLLFKKSIFLIAMSETLNNNFFQGFYVIRKLINGWFHANYYSIFPAQSTAFFVCFFLAKPSF